MPLPSSTAELLVRAFAMSGPADANAGRPETDESFVVHGGGPEGVSFIGNAAVIAYQEAVDALAQSALAHGGWNAKAVEGLVMEACRIARAAGDVVALEHVEEAINRNLRIWRVGERIYAHVYNSTGAALAVGRCFLSKGATFWADLSDHPDMTKAFADYQPAVLVTEVEAHDPMSARWRASQVFAEARAILLLACGSVQYGALAPHFVLDDSGGVSVESGPDSEPLMMVRLVTQDGTLWPGYQQLSDAAAKRSADRTDWERLTLGAARWHYEAALGRWPAASLVAAMSAIEAILCPPDVRQRKEREIARRLVKHDARIRGVSSDQREEWFTTLYGRWRNSAVHGARFYDEERDVARLVELCDRVVRWAIGHLDPEHRPSLRACESFEEAHSEHR